MLILVLNEYVVKLNVILDPRLKSVIIIYKPVPLYRVLIEVLLRVITHNYAKLRCITHNYAKLRCITRNYAEITRNYENMIQMILMTT